MRAADAQRYTPSAPAADTMKTKFKRSIFVTDLTNEVRFLFQCLNVGKNTDELKLVFTHPDSGMGGMYLETREQFTGNELIRLQPEISYHADGSLLQKMPSYSPRTDTVYKNPAGTGHRRTPLASIREWDSFAKYTVVDYNLCKKPLGSDSEIIPCHPGVFDGTPFECIFFLGHESMPSPKELTNRAVYRIHAVAAELDLLCCFYKSSYQGEYFYLPNRSERIFSRNNVLEIVKRRTNSPSPPQPGV